MASTVLLGITGCIAAYKAAEIVRGLQKAGLRVKVVMTEHATHFVDPLTFRSLTHEPVAVGLFDDPSDPIHHISLADEADAFLIAPCTANVIAKIAHGIADDLLTTTALACTAPLIIAPAMNVHMYEASATQDNLSLLTSRGVTFVDADEGYLACGYTGKGRLAAVDEIIAATLGLLGEARLADNDNDGCSVRDLTGLSVLVTAGPTQEPIDAVRYLSNYSSGKMGYSLAEAACARGASVTLVSGPVSLAPPSGVDVVPVQTGIEMLEACQNFFSRADIAVFSAAVADARPAVVFDRKLKKGVSEDADALSEIKLVPNPDILATLAANKGPRQTVVGFAAETDDLLGNARRKLQCKHADVIVANLVGAGKAFGKDTNQATLVSATEEHALPEMSKERLAHRIFDFVLQIRN